MGNLFLMSDFQCCGRIVDTGMLFGCEPVRDLCTNLDKANLCAYKLAGGRKEGQ